MATFVFFDEFKVNVTTGLINLSTDTFHVALTNTAPTVATDDELADITQIGTGGGYTNGAGGGQALDSVTWTETAGGSGIWKFSSADEVFTATATDMGPFRYVVLYSNTSTNDKLVGYLDYGTNITVTAGNTFTIDVGTDGWFQLDG